MKNDTKIMSRMREQNGKNLNGYIDKSTLM